MPHKLPKSPSRRALLSVSDKTGIVDFARTLAANGYELVSTGGTQKVLEEGGLVVKGVEKITQFPECFSGRVKTLHPLIAGGILFKREDKDQLQEAGVLGITPIDLVVVNLYPFAETERAVSDELWAMSKDVLRNSKLKAQSSKLLEEIDIGGPTLLRAAAKNFSSVTAVFDSADYARVAEQIKVDPSHRTTLDLRRELAAKVFAHVAAYDALIAEVLSGGQTHGVMLENGKTLRYGENPHQWGKYYEVMRSEVSGMSGAAPLKPQTSNLKPVPWRQLQGKDLSYLNILDADAAWRMVTEFDEPTAVFVKHANPSGIASHEHLSEAFQRAYDTDRLSAFGVIIALNRPCTEDIIQKILDQKMFVEVIIAPSFVGQSLELLKQKPNIRVLVMNAAQSSKLKAQSSYRSALGGMLVQEEDMRVITEKDLTCITKRKPTPEQLNDLLFAWKVVKHAKSNAIVFASDRVTVGIGSGQTSRVDATWIAAKRAGDKAKGAVMASDAFFPFPDAVEEAAKHGIAAVIQPGGSIRDPEVFARADELGLAMVLTGVRGFRH